MKIGKFLAVAVILLCCLAPVVYALSSYTLAYPQRITIQPSSGASLSHAVSLCFDDNSPSQYLGAWPLMKEKGIVGTWFIITNKLNWGVEWALSPEQLLDLQSHGNEIGSHSVNHRYFTQLTEEQIRRECLESKQTLENLGLTINNFDFPYSDSNDGIDRIVSEYYHSGRYGDGYMDFPVTTFQIKTKGAWACSLSRLKSYIDYAYANNKWVVMYFHTIKELSDLYSWESIEGNITPDDFRQLLDYILQRGMPTITIEQGLNVGKTSGNTEPKPQIKVYSDSALTNELPNGTLIDWGQGKIGFNQRSLWVKNVGNCRVQLSYEIQLPIGWTLGWNYDNTPINIGSVLKITFQLVVPEGTEPKTYDFGNLKIMAVEVAS